MKVITAAARKFIIITFLVVFALKARAVNEINGIWKHADKEAWIKIDSASGIASVYIHHHANTAGFIVIKDIKPNVELAVSWVGKMYAAASDSYVDIELSLQLPEEHIIVTHNSAEVLRLFKGSKLMSEE
jgi:hypothetical protein